MPSNGGIIGPANDPINSTTPAASVETFTSNGTYTATGVPAAAQPAMTADVLIISGGRGGTPNMSTGGGGGGHGSTGKPAGTGTDGGGNGGTTPSDSPTPGQAGTANTGGGGGGGSAFSGAGGGGGSGVVLVKRNAVTLVSASGVWSMQDVLKYENEGTWPT